MNAELEHVEFDWSTEWGECYECGLPAAFWVVAPRHRRTDPVVLRCCVCAANSATYGERIVRCDTEHDPRHNEDDAYLAYITMPTDEWKAVFRSLAFHGGVLEPEENEGYVRAMSERGLE